MRHQGGFFGVFVFGRGRDHAAGGKNMRIFGGCIGYGVSERRRNHAVPARFAKLKLLDGGCPRDLDIIRLRLPVGLFIAQLRIFRRRRDLIRLQQFRRVSRALLDHQVDVLAAALDVGKIVVGEIKQLPCPHQVQVRARRAQSDVFFRAAQVICRRRITVFRALHMVFDIKAGKYRLRNGHRFLLLPA